MSKKKSKSKFIAKCEYPACCPYCNSKNQCMDTTLACSYRTTTTNLTTTYQNIKKGN